MSNSICVDKIQLKIEINGSTDFWNEGICVNKRAQAKHPQSRTHQAIEMLSVHLLLVIVNFGLVSLLFRFQGKAGCVVFHALDPEVTLNKMDL